VGGYQLIEDWGEAQRANILKKPGGQIALGGIGQNHHDELALGLRPFGNLGSSQLAPPEEMPASIPSS
jgi:hypothetical protein